MKEFHYQLQSWAKILRKLRPFGGRLGAAGHGFLLRVEVFPGEFLPFFLKKQTFESGKCHLKRNSHWKFPFLFKKKYMQLYNACKSQKTSGLILHSPTFLKLFSCFLKMTNKSLTVSARRVGNVDVNFWKSLSANGAGGMQVEKGTCQLPWEFVSDRSNGVNLWRAFAKFYFDLWVFENTYIIYYIYIYHTYIHCFVDFFKTSSRNTVCSKIKTRPYFKFLYPGENILAVYRTRGRRFAPEETKKSRSTVGDPVFWGGERRGGFMVLEPT